MGKKPKKEKVTYIDDGRTLADMSGVRGSILRKRASATPHPKFKDAWNTYWDAVKMMFVPMLIVIGCLVVIYVIMALAFYLAA